VTWLQVWSEPRNTEILLFWYICSRTLFPNHIEITNKMRPYSKIYYSNVLLIAQHVSSDAPLIIRSSKTVIIIVEATITVFELMIMSSVLLETCWAVNKTNLWFYIRLWLLAAVRVDWEFPLNLDSGRKPQTYVKPEATITVFELLMMSGMSLETCWAIDKTLE